jgi:hypothetical protein
MWSNDFEQTIKMRKMWLGSAAKQSGSCLLSYWGASTDCTGQNTQKAEKTKWSVWCYLAVVSLCCGAFTFYKGLDKMFRYDSGDSYPHKYVNAYVGGDAYNYIINGTYATAFFVLTAMFVLAAIGLVIIHYLSQKENS